MFAMREAAEVVPQKKVGRPDAAHASRLGGAFVGIAGVASTVAAAATTGIAGATVISSVGEAHLPIHG
jgi:hypothetical protein